MRRLYAHARERAPESGLSGSPLAPYSGLLLEIGHADRCSEGMSSVESQGESLQEAPVVGGNAPFDPEPFGKYYLLDRIAVGGMAEVFLAKTFGHAGFQKLLVVKRILSRFEDDPAFVEMFVDEAKLTVQLEHPNIAHIHDFGKLGPHWFLAMEAVHGKDLKSIMRRLAERGERMPLEIAAVTAHEVVRGLGYAHGRKSRAGQPLNIVHRDVSPSNVLISYEGQTKIVDFGIAKAETTRDESGERHLLKGKFQYMSPEQTRGADLDHRSDLFSAGICLWEMLTGNRLFRRENDYETVEAIRTGQVPAPSSYNPKVPPELDRICLRALTVDRDARYQDSVSMQRDLQDFLLPVTPERLQPNIRAFMEDLFADEIGSEHATLQVATKLAEELHYGIEDDLELEEDDIVLPAAVPAPGQAHASGSGTLTPPEPTPDRGRLTGVLLVLMLLTMVVAGGLWFLNRPPPVPTTATLSVDIQPADAPNLSITLDGQTIGTTYGEVVPDVQHTLRITADGFEPREKMLELVAGQVYDTEIVLKAIPVEEPEPPTPAVVKKPVERRPKEPATPRVTAPVAEVAPAPVIAFRSTPEGAKVFLDGKPVGSTPLNWKSGREGESYNVEFRISGYQSVQAVVDAPPPGERRRLSRTLEPKETAVSDEPGKLSVQVSSGWAKVYVDGAYVDTTPLFEHQIAPGSYSIRVVNERTGLDRTEKVSVKGGEVARKTFRVEE